MPSNITYFERGEPDMAVCGVTPFVEGFHDEVGLGWVLNIV